jgi:hypothetical protein
VTFARHACIFILVNPVAAMAGDLDIGVGAALSMDMPDPVSKSYAQFGPGPSVQVPIRYGLTSVARLRATVRADLGVGADRVTWGQWVDGSEQRFYDDDHFAMFLASGLTLGPEVSIPLGGPIEPYFGAEGGIAWVGTYHSFGGVTRPLMDPKVNDLNSAGNVDPYTSQFAFLSEVHLGAMTTGAVGGWFELGYSMAFVGEADLSKTLQSFNARRSAYGWNAIRLGAGVNFRL